MANEQLAKQLEKVNQVIAAATNTSTPVAAVAQEVAANGKGNGGAAPAAPANGKPGAMSLLGAMAGSWITQVPLGAGSGFLLAKQNIPGAVFAALLTSLFVSMDILGRKDLANNYWPVLLGMTTVLTLTSVVPWAATLKKPMSRGKQLSLPLGVGVAACLCLLAAMVGPNKTSQSGSLLGAIITLMYVLISSSIGWHAGKVSGTSGYASGGGQNGGKGGSGTMTDAPSSQPAPDAPSSQPAPAASSSNRALHAGWAVYSVILLLLLTLFDAISQFN
jgi:hypothetical protein